jgi:hypothetical protein
MNSYEKFATNYHRYTKTAKSVSEAFKDADYASPITKYETPFKSDLRRSVEICGFLALWAILLGFLLLIVMSI